MDETRRRTHTDETNGWRWLGSGLSIIVSVGLITAAGATAYLIGKQQAAAEGKRQAAIAAQARIDQQIVRDQFTQLIAERDALRGDVAALHAELERVRSLQTTVNGPTRCMNGRLITQNGSTWSAGGPC
ncbi:hypothetical protein [Lysobacter enzymogenes]|uniref:Uncharacterized protein n=1 Tax=Lysobacter enzymogenes TaxID=69 RepID=A0AAU9AH54_LYSEN|nr:hypothetical protein [Lysobacter enzymogenes]BAV97964.1 hypothetical protein LEN_2477 [Lysobacter enzymogenes]